MKRPSVFAIKENGKTRYGMTRSYGGLAGIALRLVKNCVDQTGNPISLFDRLNYITEISEERYRNYADHPENADEFYSFIEIDSDQNVIFVDEDMLEEREYHEYPLDVLLEEAEAVIAPNPYSGYDAVRKDRLYTAMNSKMRIRTKTTAGIDMSPSSVAEESLEEVEDGSENQHMQM